MASAHKVSNALFEITRSKIFIVASGMASARMLTVMVAATTGTSTSEPGMKARRPVWVPARSLIVFSTPAKGAKLQMQIPAWLATPLRLMVSLRPSGVAQTASPFPAIWETASHFLRPCADT